MFDYHMHTRVSFDGRETGLQMALAAREAGLKEICFTDHLDYDPLGKMGILAFDTEEYNAEYDALEVPGLKIRRGMEFGITVDNREQFKQDLQRRHFDFVLGSVHFVDDLDVYYADYWQDKTVFQAERRYLEATLECVRLHEDFDVLVRVVRVHLLHALVHEGLRLCFDVVLAFAVELLAPSSPRQALAIGVDDEGIRRVEFAEARRLA